MTASTRRQAALAPVRDAMLRRAAARADLLVAEASREAQALLAQARKDAADAVLRAGQEGRAQAESLAVAERNRGRHDARAILLGTELRARDELAGRIRAAVRGLRDQPGYPEFLDRLAGLAQRAAGPRATVSEHPDGGVIARAPGVLVDCSLPRLAERAIDLLGPRIRELYAS
jgi:vacuolar-type H+-ATPase subunit H